MKYLLTVLIISTASLINLTVTQTAYADGTEEHSDTTEGHSDTTEGHSDTTEEHSDTTETEPSADLPVVTGEVKKVKPKSGKITIKHGEIANLEMPSMTMVFRVIEGIDINQFEKGDSVTFTVIEKEGKMVITTIDKAE